ncbi:MAG: hypothetical protein NDF54_02435 [archaeon GB-1867-035]|nr:hypothetical protein [Candidatus Culexmicrobium profundum]
MFYVLLEGEAESNGKASQIMRKYGECPYMIFKGVRQSKVYILFHLPVRQGWWIKYVEEHPEETFGLLNVKLVYLDVVDFRASGGRLNRGERSPCGAICPDCPSYSKCLGCPATIHYKL